MSARRRIRTGSQVVSTGGTPAPPGNVVWGPAFGNPPETEAGVAASMPALDIATDKTVGVAPLMPAAEIVFVPVSVGAQPTLPAIELAGGVTVRAVAEMSMAEVAGGKAVGVQAAMPAVDIAHAKTVGVDVAGTVDAAPFWQAIKTAVTSGGTGVTLNKPDGTQAGDLLVAVIAQANGDTGVTAPSGFTQIRNDPHAASNVSITSLWKLAGASEPADYTFTTSAGDKIASMQLIRGAHQTTPINAHNGQTGSATDPVAPSVTTTADRCLKIAVCAQFTTATTQTYTPPAGYEERADQASAGSLKVCGEVCTRVQAAQGASGSVTIDSTAILALNYAAQHIAIAPGLLTIA